jgi:hypothetical protein
MGSWRMRLEVREGYCGSEVGRAGRLGVVGHEDELLEVFLLGLERALDGCQLVVESDALLLEPLDDLLVRLADALRKQLRVERGFVGSLIVVNVDGLHLSLVVLDHGLVQPVLKGANVTGQRRVIIF